MNSLYYSGVFYEKPVPVEETEEEEPSENDEDEDEQTIPEGELPGDEAETLPGDDDLDSGEGVLPLPPGPGDEQNPVIPENTDINNRDKKDTKLPGLPQ